MSKSKLCQGEDHANDYGVNSDMCCSRGHATFLPVSCGGILADVMGLGKTLTVLTSILQSTPHAETFERFDPTIHNRDGRTNRTRATLIVVSSTREFAVHISGS